MIDGVNQLTPASTGSNDPELVVRRTTMGFPGRQVALIALFFGFLYPASIDGISANYSFVLLPFAVVLIQGGLKHPGNLLLLVMGYFAAVYLGASVYQLDLIDESGRRLVSFAIFMSIFSYGFIRIDDDMTAAFKVAVVGIGVYLAIVSISALASAGGAALGFRAKDVVGSQDVGFIYVLALWLAYADDRTKKALGLLRYPTLLGLTAGLLLTFSRASVVAMLASLALFALSSSFRWLQHISLRGLLAAGISTAGAVGLVAILQHLFPLPFAFFAERLFQFAMHSDVVRAHLLDQSSSEGTRLLLAQQILEFVSRNPVTGAGYLGVWILPDAAESSAHNQYMDVLFRTGLLGLFAYSWLILSLLRYLFRRERALFWGLLGVLVYGMFHETFKESQGGFVLAFLIGMLAQALREKRVARAVADTKLLVQT